MNLPFIGMRIKSVHAFREAKKEGIEMCRMWTLGWFYKLALTDCETIFVVNLFVSEGV